MIGLSDVGWVGERATHGVPLRRADVGRGRQKAGTSERFLSAHGLRHPPFPPAMPPPSAFSLVADHLQSRAESLADLPTLPTKAAIDQAFASLVTELPEEGLGTDKTLKHLLEDVVQGLAMGQAGPHVRPFCHLDMSA